MVKKGFYYLNKPALIASVLTPLVTNVTPGTARNDFTGPVGLRIVMGESSATVYKLGRWVYPGSTGSHLITIRDSGNTILASATVSLAGQTSNTFAYVACSPYVLQAGGTYFIMSNEVAGGDIFLDGNNTGVQTSILNASIYSAYYLSGSFGVVSPNVAYGPVSFLYA